jgi:hypothetical protein
MSSILQRMTIDYSCAYVLQEYTQRTSMFDNTACHTCFSTTLDTTEAEKPFLAHTCNSLPANLPVSGLLTARHHRKLQRETGLLPCVGSLPYHARRRHVAKTLQTRCSMAPGQEVPAVAGARHPLQGAIEDKRGLASVIKRPAGLCLTTPRHHVHHRTIL